MPWLRVHIKLLRLSAVAPFTPTHIHKNISNSNINIVSANNARHIFNLANTKTKAIGSIKTSFLGNCIRGTGTCTVSSCIGHNGCGSVFKKVSCCFRDIIDEIEYDEGDVTIQFNSARKMYTSLTIQRGLTFLYIFRVIFFLLL